MTVETTRSLVVRTINNESDGVLSLELVDPGGGKLPEWEPGSHIDIHTPAGPRQYSVCGRPDNKSVWKIAVLLEPASRGGSKWIHTALRSGDSVDVTGPRNHFPLTDHATYVFIAGGIGITPLLPMISAVQSRGGDWRLLYGGRQRASMAFLDELSKYGERVTVWPQDEKGLLDLDSALVPSDGLGVYCCGPEPLLAAVQERCNGWPASTVRMERFAPKPDDHDTAYDGEFEVVCSQSGRTVTIPAGVTIFDALDREGIVIPHSCLEGTCGSCETVVLDGVPDHRDSVLDEAEQAEGKLIMPCISRSRTPRLVLDL